MTRVNVVFNNHEEHILAYVTKLSGVQMILGTPWFQTHQPHINWEDMSLTFCSDHCLRYCIHNHKPCYALSSRHCKRVFHKTPNPCFKKARHPKAPPLVDIAFISSQAAAGAISKGEDVTLTSFEDIHMMAEMDDEEWSNIQYLRAAGAKVLPEDFEKFQDRMEQPHMTKEEILAKLPQVLHPLYQGFDPKEAEELPPHREKLDHEIELQNDPDTYRAPRPVSHRLRPISRDEAQAVKLYIDDMMKKEQIERSTSEWAAPLLIVKKPGGGIRICVDYRGLNAHTIKNRNTPPLIRDMLTRLSKARFFSKVNVIAAFNKMRIKEEHKHLSAFITPYGLYQSELATIKLYQAYQSSLKPIDSSNNQASLIVTC
jgi:hypothetical protein